MTTTLAPRPVWIPVITALPDGALVRITAVRADEIVYDRVADLDGTTLSTAHGVPFSGYDPETDDLPSLDNVVATIANPMPAKPTVPASVTQRQLRLQLLTLGVTDVMVLSQLSGNEAARIEWEYATEIARNHPLVTQLAASLGLTSEQTDAAFVAAAQL